MGGPERQRACPHRLRAGQAVQHLTTAEPDDSMLEVAIESLKLVLPEEKAPDAW